MRPRSLHGGRHELGQNFLVHRPTLDRIVSIVGDTTGDILEIGAGDGALTVRLARLRRDLTAIEIDGSRVDVLRRRLPHVAVEHADVLRHPLDVPVIVGNVPFHLTTPILRRLLGRRRWHVAVLLTQWEVARKRAGVGGGTMMTAQAAPWFVFALRGRVPADGFRPRPAVDGGLLVIARRERPLVPDAERRAYERFVRAVFAGPGRGVADMVRNATGAPAGRVRRVLGGRDIDPRRLPRDLSAADWAALWAELGRRP
ncbi:23S ribosomal RNA methyltransferase Erm [Microbacterium betulae]|uniref:23S ribosomal RNA methyltransferase Erm n=1 Tax=Microbacterium betulae TaxID=2981139 RepID=A0AA97FGF2_9MICO|nr:23S ribosomal RNA methyltransferase Erm [Microbacterium sp. AB]WOF22423.1 23S ribosomal RNA methyltransferase Erm [Microbacterium sp. AB]